MKKPLLLFIIVFISLFSLFAEKYGNSLIEFDVPDELEIQNETLSSLRKIVVGSDLLDAGDSFQVILQQKGLNALSQSAFNQYCRIMISVIDAGEDTSTNADFKKEYDSYSSSELNEIYDSMELIFNGGVPIVSYAAKDTATIADKFALHMAYTRESTSTEKKGNVFVNAYYFVVQGHYFFVTCSYRVSEKQQFAPAIDKFMKSFKVLTEEDEALSVSNKPIQYVENELYTQTLPWVSTSFLWPVKNVSWKQTSDYSGTYKSIEYDGVNNLGHNTTVMVTNLKTRISALNKKASLNSILTNGLMNLKSALKQYNYKITQQEIKNDAVYVSYEYSAYGVSVLGRICYRFPDNYRMLGVESEYFKESENEVDKIYKSLGF